MQIKKNLEEKKIINENSTRKSKLLSIKTFGFHFPSSFKTNTNSKKLNKKYKNYDREYFKKREVIVSIAGRIIQKREMSKSIFFTIKDMNNKIQIYYKKKSLTKKKDKKIKEMLDVGDIIGIKGYLFKTKTNELTINCKNLTLLVKSLHCLPDKYHGLINKELCYRKRYLDLIMNKKTFNVFEKRSDIISKIRSLMKKRKFLEVETPILQSIPGGATARPFVTYNNSLNINMFLRIAPELYLKRLIIGGFKKIFEINKSFRNEGLSVKHNPEFTMMEAYIAYADYTYAMKLIEELFLEICFFATGKDKINFNGHQLDFNSSFKKMTMKESILYFNSKIELSDLNDYKKLLKICSSLGINTDPVWGIGKLLGEIFEKTVEKNLIQPIFITDYPTEISPLAKCKKDSKHFTERFELFIAGYEIGNGFSELNDSEEQKNRFLQQIRYNTDTKDSNFFYDEDYITALEHGLPPTAGLGIGIDRLIMIFTNKKNIRDVIFFPTLRPFNN